ncbi:MAG TPA: DUF4230 domain-containing protein [Bryobacteraceae bacterium]|jgi:hypothetical protein
MSKLIAFISTFALIFLIIGLIVYARFYAPGATWLRPLNEPAVVTQVRQLKTLVTVRYVVQKAVGVTEPRQPLGEESILLMVQGQALAGVDLGSITQYDVQVSGKKIKIRLPQPQIIDISLDEQNTKVWDRRITWWTPWVSPDKDLEHKARLTALDEIRKTVLGMGILRDAEANARSAIRDLIAAMGGTAEVWSAS